MQKEFFSISQAARAAELPPSVLRFWEQEFGEFLAPCRTTGNQRRYTRQDLSVIMAIKDLLRNRKVKLEGAREILARQLRLRGIDTDAEAQFRQVAEKMRDGRPLDEWQMLLLVFKHSIAGVFGNDASRRFRHFHAREDYRPGPVMLRPVDLRGSSAALLIAFGQIGDVVWMKPCIERLKAAWPETRFSILVWDVCRMLYAGHPAVEREFVLDKMRMADDLLNGRKRPSELLQELQRLIEQLRGEDFDTVLNLTRIPTAGLIASLVNAPRVFGELITPQAQIVTVGSLWTALHQSEYRDRLPWRGPHRAEQLLRAFTPGPASRLLQAGDTHWGISPSRAAAVLSENGYRYDSSRIIVGIQTAARKGSRSWQEEKLVDLAGLLAQDDAVQVMLFGADKDQSVAEQVVAALGTERVINMVGKTGLHELAGLLKLCEVLISPNTGPKHLALSVGTPVVEISTGEDSFYSAGPYGPHSIVLRADLACGRCKQYLCRQRLCKERISAEAVLQAVRIQQKLRRSCRTGVDTVDLSIVAGDLTHPALSGVNVYYSGSSDPGVPFTYQPLKERFSAQRSAKRISYYALSLVWDDRNTSLSPDAAYLARLAGLAGAAGYRGIESWLLRWTEQLQRFHRLAESNRRLAGEGKEEGLERLIGDRQSPAAAIVALRWKLNEYRIVGPGAAHPGRDRQVLVNFCASVADDCARLIRVFDRCCDWCRDQAVSKEVHSWDRPLQSFPLEAGVNA